MEDSYNKLLDSLGALSFRVTFYSRPNFISNFLSNEIEAENFQCRLMSEEERQRIDIDSVSIELGNSIDEIVAQQIYIFYGAPLGGLKADIYVGPFFLFIDVDTSGHIEAVSSKLFDSIVCILDRLKKYSSDISTARFSIKGEISMFGDKKDMQAIHRMPENINEELLNFRNASEYEVGDYLLQIIQTGRTGIIASTGEPMMNVTTDGIASCHVDDCENFNFASAIGQSNDMLFSKVKDLYNLDVLNEYNPE